MFTLRVVCHKSNQHNLPGPLLTAPELRPEKLYKGVFVPSEPRVAYMLFVLPFGSHFQVRFGFVRLFVCGVSVYAPTTATETRYHPIHIGMGISPLLDVEYHRDVMPGVIPACVSKIWGTLVHYERTVR